MESPPDQPEWLWRGRVPCLDGLRGISILLVLAAHSARTRDFPLPAAVSQALTHVGALGVSMFFVISGFLITLLLTREYAQRGSISLRHFYLRRGFRIVPAYLAYLLVILVLSSGDHIRLTGKDWLIVLTYTGSIFPIHIWELVHTWSLAIEEQFYLIWPFLMVLLNRRQAGSIAAGCAVLTLLARVFCLRYCGGIEVDYFTLTRMDCIALGCLLAIAVTEPSLWKVRRFLSQGGVWPGIFAAAGLALSFALAEREVSHLVLHDWPSPAFLDVIHYRYAIVANTVNALLICTIIWSFCRHRQSWPGRLLETRPIVVLGVMSYSVYLWQQLFLNWSHKGWWVCQWPLNLLWVSLAATASYYLIESPFLRLKHRFV